MSKSTIREICSNDSNASDNEHSYSHMDEYECDHNEYECATLELADRFQRAWRSLSWFAFTGDKLTTSKNIVKSVIGFNFSWLDMRHLASPLFLRHLASNSPELAESLQEVMHAIYVCNTAYYDWYQYYNADVFSHMSIFLGEQFTSYAPIPPYIESIGSLHELEFYDKWLTHYNIYSRLQWLIYTAAILKKKINKKMPLSYRDALINNGGVVKQNTPPLKISCIQLVFNKKYILSNSIAAFLGKKKY